MLSIIGYKDDADAWPMTHQMASLATCGLAMSSAHVRSLASFAPAMNLNGAKRVGSAFRRIQTVGQCARVGQIRPRGISGSKGHLPGFQRPESRSRRSAGMRGSPSRYIGSHRFLGRGGLPARVGKRPKRL